MKRVFVKAIFGLGALAALALVFAAVFLSTGAYNVAADVPHWAFTHSVLEKVRARSIAQQSAGIEIPPLDNAALVTTGAGNYDAMCAGCHLKPGIESTEMSRGLYPAPPSLVQRPLENPAAAFWVIKHGNKMSGMPAWGKSMDDQYVWGLVAFLKELPGISESRYHELVEASGGHRHGGSESGMEVESSDHEHEHNQGEDGHSEAAPHQH